MTVVLHKFKTESEWLAARKSDVTSTEIACLFGLGYKSRLQLWHEKNGSVENSFVGNDLTDWGRWLQIPVGMKICADSGYEPFDLEGYYYQDTELRNGASMDIRAVCPSLGNILMEVKVAEEFSEKSGWTINSAPIPYEFQLQDQLHLADKHGTPFDMGMIATLGRRQKVGKYQRPYDRELGKQIDEALFDFWASIKAGDPPPPDYRVDGELLEKIAPALRAGETRNLSDNETATTLAKRYFDIQEKMKPLRAEIKKLDDDKAEIKARLIPLLGNAEIIKIGDFQIKRPEIIVEDSVKYGHTIRRFDLTNLKGRKK